MFCNAIETVNSNDLALLHDLVTSLQPVVRVSPTIQKLYDRFKALYEIASRIIELRKSQDDRNRPGISGLEAGDMPLGANLNQLQPGGEDGSASASLHVPPDVLHQAGLANPADTEGWFQDYQQMLDQLKEDDLFLFGANILTDC